MPFFYIRRVDERAEDARTFGACKSPLGGLWPLGVPWVPLGGLLDGPWELLEGPLGVPLGSLGALGGGSRVSKRPKLRWGHRNRRVYGGALGTGWTVGRLRGRGRASRGNDGPRVEAKRLF